MNCYQQLRTIWILTLLLAGFLTAHAQDEVPHFFRLTYNNGLSDNKVNCILKSHEGYIWAGTPQGLNRYDGFRIRVFYANPRAPHTLPDNNILNLYEDAEGQLWVNTPAGHCRFNPKTEQVNRNTDQWLHQHHVGGHLLMMDTDEKHNLWVLAINPNKLYYYDFQRCHATAMKVSPRQLNNVTSIHAEEKGLCLVYNRGAMAWVDRNSGTIAWTDHYIPNHDATPNQHYHTISDRQGNRWAWAENKAYCYQRSIHAWRLIYDRPVNDVALDHGGHVLLATDHNGLVMLDKKGKELNHWLNLPTDSRSLSDNTLQCLYVDDHDALWIGFYRMGMAVRATQHSLFKLIPLGDICTMTQGRDGYIWLGTNDNGIWRYDLKKNLQHISPAQSGLSSEVIVAALTDKDGSLWFGSYQGGLAHLKDGRWTTYRQHNSQLAINSVWALAQLHDGSIAIATLGGGLQILDCQSDKFTTYNTRNSNITSDYLSSLSVAADGTLAIGHSQGISLLRPGKHRFQNIGQSGDPKGNKLTSLSVNQVLYDTHARLWIANTSGLNVLEPNGQQLNEVNLQNQNSHTEVCALAEDHYHNIWASTSNGLMRISVQQSKDGSRYLVTPYGHAGGLQNRLFNKRSILCLRDGRVLVGGIDGINIVLPWKARQQQSKAHLIFSGLTLFDHVVGVGDSINGHVVLTQSLNSLRKLVLNHDENTFTIQLATTLAGQQTQPQILYRLRGEEKQWSVASGNDPCVHLTNLSPGKYTLEVRLTDANGLPSQQIEQMSIVIRQPFYLQPWALLIYLTLAALAVWNGRRRWRLRRTNELEKMELKKQKEIEEAKMVFFTNISHELRTPLTLIIAPIESMMKQNYDTATLHKLHLINRNAHQLLMMVNKMLDLRRIMRGKEKITLSTGDLITFVHELCEPFASLSEKAITLTFHTDVARLTLAFDKGKVDRMVTNLLSNAYKFTPQGGRVDVTVSLEDHRQVIISVADNGPGISDQDKAHLFERFYQGEDGKEQMGSGIGLNLSWEYAKMLGGTIKVEDNKGGGTRFTIVLPAKDLQVEGDGYVQALGNAGMEQDSFAVCNTADGERSDTNEHQPTLLLVDDNPDFLNFLKTELQASYRILCSVNGKQALDVIHHEIPDLVITDVMMPEMDGNELCRQIKGNDRTHHLPVMMLTARLADENEIESRECGADDYIKKPFSMDLFKLHIDQLLKQGRIVDNGKVDPKISKPTITPQDEVFIDKATLYVEEHLSDSELTVEQMSDDLAMSRVQLYRRLVGVTGKTPSEFIRLVRLRHAERLLVQSQLSIAEISYKVGFSSTRYFSRCFKDLYGYLPSKYKKNAE